MVIVKVDLPSHINDQFKSMVIERYGLRRGAITLALLEAIKLWTEQSDNTNGEISESNDFLIPEDLKNKYLAVVDNEVRISTNSLKELWDELPADPKDHYEIFIPHMPKKRKVRLGWSGSFKRK